MKIEFGGQTICLHPSGIAILPAMKLAVVSDMHLEKASHFARRGFFLPPYDSHATLARLHRVLAEEKIERLLVLGDCFHDAKGYQRLPPDAYVLFDDLRRFRPIWVVGNHDGEFVPDGFSAYQVYEEKNIFFRHQAAAAGVNEISGHFHPKAQISHKDAKISRPCFAEDGNRLLMPAFGVYTGGLFVSEPAIQNLFVSSPSLYLIGGDRTYKV